MLISNDTKRIDYWRNILTNTFKIINEKMFENKNVLNPSEEELCESEFVYTDR